MSTGPPVLPDGAPPRGRSGQRPSWNRGLRRTFPCRTFVVRSRACSALAVAFSFTLVGRRPRTRPTPRRTTTADAAVAWLKTQQQPDGGFEVAGVPRLRDPRRRRSRSPSRRRPARRGARAEALAAVGALHYGGGPRARRRSTRSTPSPPRVTTAGAAAKTIVLERVAARPRPDGVRSRRRRHAGEPRRDPRLGGCAATPPASAAFNDTLYGDARQELVCGAPPPAALATDPRRAAGDGGWNFIGDPTGTDVDPDTTGLAVQALVAGGADADRPRGAARRSRSSPPTSRPSGAWQFFGADDPNSTVARRSSPSPPPASTSTSSCWRDTVAPGARGHARTRARRVAALAAAHAAGRPGRIASPNDSFGVNTFATSQTVEGLPAGRGCRSRVAAAPTCAVPRDADSRRRSGTPARRRPTAVAVDARAFTG